MVKIEVSPQTRKREKFYCTVYSSAFSPNGKLMAVGDCFGRVTVVNLVTLISPQLEESSSDDSRFQFQSDRGAIYSLLTVGPHLLVGGTAGLITAYRWSDLEKNSSTVAFVLSNGQLSFQWGMPEVNSLVAHPDGLHLLCGNGTNEISQWHLETGQLVSTYKGHTDYVQCVAVRDENSFVSGSEDGTVRLWDSRTKQSQMTIEPHKTENCLRPKLGNWIGCVAAEPNWLVCGGGVELSIWNFATTTVTGVMSSGDTKHYGVMFYDNKILSVGSKPHVSHWDFKGESKAKIPATSPCLYDLKLNANSKRHRMIVACGASDVVDFYINPMYKSFSLPLY